MRNKAIAIFRKLNLRSGHQRSVRAKKNILSSIIIKGANIVLNFFYVPILLDYLGQEEYGVWLTISSVVTWFGFFDIGLGHGLRNKLSVALANKNYKLAKKYVSTTYAVLLIIALTLIIVFSISAHFINWNSIFNTTIIDPSILLIVVLIVFNAFFLRFVFQIISVILLADQRPAISDLFNLITNALTLFIIFFLMRFSKTGTLEEFSFILSVVPLFVFLLSSIILYRTKYRKIMPSFSFIELSLTKDLLGLGIMFFIIHMADIIMYTSTNFLISSFINPGEVVVYNIAYKLFSVSTMLFTIVLTPMWSAITDAYAQNDFDWIKRSVKKIQKLGLIMSVGVVVLLIISPFVYNIWIGERVKIPFEVSAVIAFTAVLRLSLSVFVSFQNGIGRIRTVMFMSIIQAVFYIPFAYLLSSFYNLGIVGIVLAGVIIEIPIRIQQVSLYYKVVNKQKLGRWMQ